MSSGNNPMIPHEGGRFLESTLHIWRADSVKRGSKVYPATLKSFMITSIFLGGFLFGIFDILNMDLDQIPNPSQIDTGRESLRLSLCGLSPWSYVPVIGGILGLFLFGRRLPYIALVTFMVTAALYGQPYTGVIYLIVLLFLYVTKFSKAEDKIEKLQDQELSYRKSIQKYWS
jgi:hypothetical protein